MSYEEKIDKVRSYFDEHKAERYPLVNTMLAEKDEYIKSLYFRMLCMLVRYTDEPSEMQNLYIRRLIAGANAENAFQDYMRMAIEVETKDIEDFISIISDDELRYYFCIDGAVLLSVISNDKNFELLAELVEMLGISKNELKYLMKVTRSIILQDSDLFDEAKGFITDSTKQIDMYHYVKGFYSGDTVNTPYLLHITSFDKSQIDLSDYQFWRSKIVIIENIEETIDEAVIFDGCKEVVIKNCKLLGNNYSFRFDNVDSVIISGCEISNFAERFAYFENTNHITIHNCKIRNCGCTRRYERGGVLIADRFDSIKLDGNELLNCYVGSDGNDAAKGIFLHADGGYNAKITVENNKFIDCDCRNIYDWVKSYISGSFGNATEQGNTCSGTVTKIFE